MKIEYNNKYLLLLLIIAVSYMLVGCKGKEIDNENVVYKYDERIEAIFISNKLDEVIYTSFNVVLLDENNEVLYKQLYEDKKLGDKEELNFNLEDIKPDWLQYDKVKSINIEILKVYDYCNFVKYILIFLMCFFLCIFFIAIYIMGINRFA